MLNDLSTDTDVTSISNESTEIAYFQDSDSSLDSADNVVHPDTGLDMTKDDTTISGAIIMERLNCLIYEARLISEEYTNYLYTQNELRSKSKDRNYIAPRIRVKGNALICEWYAMVAIKNPKGGKKSRGVYISKPKNSFAHPDANLAAYAAPWALDYILETEKKLTVIRRDFKTLLSLYREYKKFHGVVEKCLKSSDDIKQRINAAAKS